MLKVSQACVAYVSLAGFKSKHFIGSVVYKDYIKTTLKWLETRFCIRDLLDMAVFKLTYHASLETRLFGCTVRNWQVVFQEGSKKAETDTKCYSQLNKILTKGCTGIWISSSHAFFIPCKFQVKLYLSISTVFNKMLNKVSPAYLSSLQNSFYYVTWSIQPLSLDKSFFLCLWVFLLHSVSVVTADNMDTKSSIALNIHIILITTWFPRCLLCKGFFKVILRGP